MGKIVTTNYFDDFNNVPVDAEIVDTVPFSYRGRDYTLVLSPENGAQFDKDMARYIKAAKRAEARDARAAAQKTPSARTRRAKSTNGTAADRVPAPARRSNSTGTRKPATVSRRSTTSATPKAVAARPKTATRNGTMAAGRERTRAIREWARANGHTVSERGRIAEAVVAAYDAAN